VNRSAGNPLPDEPWPVSARDLLSRREKTLYQTLVVLYPDHRLLVQVALSQLINIDRNHPQSESIRARYKQLVADFVLCRSDLSVVAVIELDDRTHAWPKRKAADARKNRALADARIRLVRIPAGRLPSPDTLRALVDAGAVEEGTREETMLSLVQTVDIYDEASMHAWRDHSSEESREVKRVVLRAITVAVLLLGGWFIFSHVLPAAIKQAFQPLATAPARRTSSTRQPSFSVISPQIPTAPVVSQSSAEELGLQKQQTLRAANALQKKKDLAWAAFYSAPASCEHPADWSAQVECGNQYMRAKKVFEQKWEAEHPVSQGTAAEVVLDSASVRGGKK
jgi:Protein of unknown function (DUF2726)